MFMMLMIFPLEFINLKWCPTMIDFLKGNLRNRITKGCVLRPTCLVFDPVPNDLLTRSVKKLL